LFVFSDKRYLHPSMNLSHQIALELHGQTVYAHKDRGLMIHDTLVISDIHFGKVNHFRKAGIQLPQAAVEANFLRLKNLILRYEPKQVAFLGDFFHSELNEEWRLVTDFLNNPDFNCKWILIEGNHDVLDPVFYVSANLELMPFMTLGKFLLTHEPMEEVPAGFTNVHGHIHPGIKLKGKARQRFSVACFHLQKQHLCMPAFGELTGLAIRKLYKNDRTFAVTDEGIFEVSNL
jgi:DNA ligase-associated metallophosphoesterase